MTVHIALAGKGSAGKSTLVPHLLIQFTRQLPTARVLVVDADPHMSTTTLLGVTQPRTLGQLRSRYERTFAVGASLRDETREDFAERAMGHEALMPQEGFDLLTMGHWELPGSQCTVNRVLERALVSLANQYDLVLYDNEAGIEHMGRFATIPLDLLLLVATPDPLFLDVAARVLDRSREVKRQIMRRWLVLNRIEPGDFEQTAITALLPTDDELEIAALLPESHELRHLSRTRQSPLLLDRTDPWAVGVADLGTRIARCSFTQRTPVTPAVSS